MSSDDRTADDAMLDSLQQQAFRYFLHETNPANGLVADKTRAGWPCSIAATGLALASYPVGVERGFVSRGEAAACSASLVRRIAFRMRIWVPQRHRFGSIEARISASLGAAS